MTYRPRLVLFDMPANLGAVSRDGSIGGQPPPGDSPQLLGMWDGPVVVCHSEAVQPSAFVQQLGEEWEEEEEQEDDDEGGGSWENRNQEAAVQDATLHPQEGPDPLDVRVRIASIHAVSWLNVAIMSPFHGFVATSVRLRRAMV